jgi:hypothetical protein
MQYKGLGMATDDSQKYLVRDPQGNVYGPADVAVLEQWIMQGRIVAGMHIAPRETGEWAEVSTHPALAHLFPKESAPQAPPAPTSDVEPAPPTPSVAQPPTPYGAQIPATPPEMYPVTPVIPTSADSLPGAAVGPRQNLPALVSLVTGLLTVIFGAVSPCLCICVPFVFLLGLAAIISGGLALSKMKSDPALYTGRGQAIAGMALGIGGLLLSVLLLVGAFALHFKGP